MNTSGKKNNNEMDNLPFAVTTGRLYSQDIQLCQNCPVHDHARCSGTVDPNATTSEDCYSRLDPAGDVQMVSFDQRGTCWTYNSSTCMEPPNTLSDHGSWSARLSNPTGNPILQFTILFILV